MSQETAQIKGIIAYITTDKNRYLGGQPLGLLVKDRNDLTDISEAIARAFLAEILQLKSGDCMIIKK